MPINLAPVNVPLLVKRLAMDEKTKKHLESLGMVHDAEIRVISSVSGDVVVDISGMRLAISREVGAKVIVAVKG